jgi:hypothetical protein
MTYAINQFAFELSVFEHRDLNNMIDYDEILDCYFTDFMLWSDVHYKEIKKEFDFHELITKQTFKTDAEKLDKNIRDSTSRAIQIVSNIGKSNNWEYFLTLTFNKHKVDSLDYEITSKSMSNWLSNIKRDNPNMIYLAVPELHHISKRFHFHVLVANVPNLKLVDSNKRSYGKYIFDVNKVPKWVKNLDKVKIIYNIGNYSLGWSTATKIQDCKKSVGYLVKYINKDLVASVPKGKKKYWNSKNVKKPTIETMYFTHEKLLDYIENIKKSNPRFTKKIVCTGDYNNEINIFEFSTLE